MGALMNTGDPLPAARHLDPICHSVESIGLMVGLGVGVVLGTLVLAASTLTGPGLVVVAALEVAGVAGLAASTQQLAHGLKAFFNLPDPTTSVLVFVGSEDVRINGRRAYRAALDASAGCVGLLTHPALPLVPIPVAEGSRTVMINGKPAATQSSRLMCGASIKSGSDDVMIGGPLVAVLPVLDFSSLAQALVDGINWASRALTIIGTGGAFLGVEKGLLQARELLEDVHAGLGDIVLGGTGVALSLLAAKAALRSPTHQSVYGGGPREGGALYEVDTLGRTTYAEGRVTGPHPRRPKGARPDPPGGRFAGDHRGHLIPEGGVDTPAYVNVPENIISESPASNLGPKKTFDNLASKTAAQNPESVVTTQHQPQYSGANMRPDAVTHTITIDGDPVHSVTISNPSLNPPVNR